MKPIGPYPRSAIALALGEVLKKARMERGISQDTLATLCDFDRTYPSLLERGKRHPTLAMIYRLAGALQMKAEELVDRTETVLRVARLAATPPALKGDSNIVTK